ncbi:MAG: hypothetical protein COC19_08390 [SAR86 cluster bacterium]|uniref:DUF3501 domain-containing protein n=1 Tax=SAR86 cluster bacterium TaxID=2030880 RepID=A0A2A4MF37_9GAMM|nr:MAG: hypothetical protein COC19_08390 [SAR86 cluster bacterium]
MKKLTTSDLLSPEAYADQRPALRLAMMEHKQLRRVALGPNATLHFEDFMTMRYQVQELMRVEKISGEEELAQEFAVYNPLIPDGKNLKATFMLEYPDEEQRRIQLGKLIDVENRVFFEIEGFDQVPPICNEDLARSTAEKTSAVHFMRFEFSKEMIAAIRAGASWSIGCDHPAYTYNTGVLSAPVSKTLLNDFD